MFNGSTRIMPFAMNPSMALRLTASLPMQPKGQGEKALHQHSLKHACSPHRTQPHKQRRFLPQRENPQILSPPLALFHKLEVEIPQHARQYETHFRICEISTDAVARTHREGLACALIIICVAGVLPKPPLWSKDLGVLEVAGRVRRGVYRGRDCSLRSKKKALLAFI